MRLARQATIVTGGTRGIGRAIALAFAREGADVLVVGRDAAAGTAVCSEIEVLGRRGVWHHADLGRGGEAGRVVDAAMGAFGRLDVLVNNAGLFQRKPVLEIEERIGTA
jgi:NAD(P)-dependent dehydrogenase (short-subunit alcohol dehydrogenase family)